MIITIDVDNLYYSQSILIEPPKTIKQSDCICSKKFYLEPIIEMYKTESYYGIIAITADQTEIYIAVKSGSYTDCKLKYKKNSKFT